MKRLLSIVLICVLVPCAYGETINYDNGDKYVGEVVNGLPSGQGTYTWADGDKYVGQFWMSKKSGQGTYIWADRTKYVGDWMDDKPWKGIQYSSSGQVAGTYNNGDWCKGCKPESTSTASNSSSGASFCVLTGSEDL